jgi:hypothetical protein
MIEFMRDRQRPHLLPAHELAGIIPLMTGDAFVAVYKNKE